ncbi:MAG: transcription antitermination protein NusB, partial [Agrococcus casei]
MTARSVAMSVVLDVHEDDVFANLALPSRLQQARLSTADAAFATELTYGTLRWQGQYDAVIEALASRPITQIDPEPLAALRIGMHQIAR